MSHEVFLLKSIFIDHLGGSNRASNYGKSTQKKQTQKFTYSKTTNNSQLFKNLYRVLSKTKGLSGSF